MIRIIKWIENIQSWPRVLVTSASLQRALGLSSQGGSLRSAFSVASTGPHSCLVGFAYDGHWLPVSGCSLPGVSDFPCP